MAKIKRVTIKKTPVKVTSISFEISVLNFLGEIAEDKGYTKSAYVNKILKAHLEDVLTYEAQENE